MALKYRSAWLACGVSVVVFCSFVHFRARAFAQESPPAHEQEPPPAQVPPAPAPPAAAEHPTQPSAAPAPAQPVAPEAPPSATPNTAPAPPAAPTETAAPTASAPEPESETPAAFVEDPASAAELGTVTVTAHKEAGRIEAGPLGNRSIYETPFSVGHADAEQISRIAATTIDRALGYDASVRANNSGVASGNTFSVRGQAVDLTNGYKVDGLAFPYWFQDHPIEALSEIQVLKGAGGFVYGYASPSGVVNFVSKRPTQDLLIDTNLSLRSSSIWRAHVDVGGPFREGGTTAFRFNAGHEQGTLYNGAENKNDFAALWVQGNIIPNLTWSVDGFYQRTWQSKQSNSISLGPNVTHLDTVNGTLNLGAASTAKWNDIAQLTGRLNYQITPNWHASVALRQSTLDERFPGNTIQITNNAGDYQSGLLNMNRLFHYYVGQASIDGSFHTGPIEHTVVLGFDYLDVGFDHDYQPYVANGRPTTTFTFGLNGNLYRGAVPDFAGDPTALAFERPPQWFRYQEIHQRAGFISDTLRFAGAELLVGGRYTSYKENNNEPVQPDINYSEASFTPIAALSYDLVEGVRAYASYVQALQRGTQAPPNALNAGQTFGPIRSTQYEAGVKVQQPIWSATLAAFRTGVPSEYLAAAAPDQMLGRWVRAGERRYQGIEAEGRLQPNREWLLNLSTAFLDAKQTEGADPSVVGKRVPGTTGIQGSGFIQYAPAFFPGFRLFGGLRYSGKAYAQATNTFTFSPSTVGDLGAGYVTAVDQGELQLLASLQNIADTQYWIPNATGTGLSAGAPRTFSVSVGWSPTGKGVSGAQRSQVSAASTAAISGHWYLGLQAGVVKPTRTSYDVQALIDPSLGRVKDGLHVSQEFGPEVAGEIGYDFGLFRSEFEANSGYVQLRHVTLKSDQVPIDSSNPAAGRYSDPSGHTHILALMFNQLIDIGGNERTPWAVQAGGGLGLVRFNSWRWRLKESQGPTFQVDNASSFAWQATVGVRRRLTEHVDLTLRYRFFNVPSLKLFTANANQLTGDLSSHSVLIGANVNF
jgi:iron complex outermembrane receptor protein